MFLHSWISITRNHIARGITIAEKLYLIINREGYIYWNWVYNETECDYEDIYFHVDSSDFKIDGIKEKEIGNRIVYLTIWNNNN